MKKFPYAFRWINNREQFIKSYREQMIEEGSHNFLVQQNRKQLQIIEMMAFALALMAMVVAFKVMWRED